MYQSSTAGSSSSFNNLKYLITKVSHYFAFAHALIPAHSINTARQSSRSLHHQTHHPANTRKANHNSENLKSKSTKSKQTKPAFRPFHARQKTARNIINQTHLF